MAQDDITIERIKKAHPVLRDGLKRQYLECNNKVLGKGVRLRFSWVYRSKKEQQDLYDQGRTKPGRIVTNAEPGESYHNYGLAFDIVLLYDNDGNGTFEEASWDTVRDGDGDSYSDWMEVVKFFKDRGWTWGGDFKSIKDRPHFQKTFGYHWREIKEMEVDCAGYPILTLA